MSQPDTQFSKATPSARDKVATSTAEPRAFSEGAATDIGGDGPAELLMDEVRAGPNTIPEPQADGTAAFHDAPPASASPLKSAANEFGLVVSDVLKGKAGSARVLAADAYEQLRGRSRESLVRADTLVRQRPYAALGAAVVFGMLFASLTRRRR